MCHLDGTEKCHGLAHVKVSQLWHTDRMPPSWHTSRRLFERQDAIDIHPAIQSPAMNHSQQSLGCQFVDNPNRRPMPARRAMSV